jgi:hypothetical protein
MKTPPLAMASAQVLASKQSLLHAKQYLALPSDRNDAESLNTHQPEN